MARFMIAASGALLVAIGLAPSTVTSQARKPPSTDHADGPTYKLTPVSTSPLLTTRYVGATRQQLDKQRESLARVAQARVYNDARDIPSMVYGEADFSIPGYVGDREGLAEALAPIRAILLAEGTEELTLAEPANPDGRFRHIRLQQSIRGIPVSDGTLKITVRQDTGQVVSIIAKFLPDRGLPQAPRLSAADALLEAFDYIERLYELDENRPRIKDDKGILPEPSAPHQRPSEPAQAKGDPVLSYRIGAVESQLEPARLIWTVTLDPRTAPVAGVLVDAVNGEVIATHGVVTISRQIYDSNGGTGLGVLKRAEGNPPVADAVVNTVYDNFGFAFSALDLLGEIGFTTQTFRISVRNTLKGDHNAWSAGLDLGFGRGISGSTAAPNTHLGNALDTVAHELSHSIAWMRGQLQCTGIDCGFTGLALNEGLADVAATAVDMNYSRPYPWRLGEDTWAPGLAARDAVMPPLMSLSSRDWYPQRSLGLSGSHANATILTHAYYLALNGGYHWRAGLTPVPSILVPPLGRQKAEDIFYGSMLAGEFFSNETFPGAKVKIQNRAYNWYGQAEMDSVRLAFEAVGVGGCTTPPAIPVIATEHMCPWWKVLLYPVTGATTYHSQYSLYPSYSPAGDFHDSPDTGECELYTDVWIYFRARACNACGCSGWSPNAIAYPWAGECP